MNSKELRGLYEAYNEVYAPQEVDEAVKGESGERREDLAAERRSGIKPLSAKEGEGYASHKLSQMSYVKRKRMGEEVEEVGEEMKPLPKNKMFRKAGNLGRDIVSPATGDEDRQKKYGRQKKIIRQLNKANEQLEESGLSQDTIRSAAKERQKRVDTAYAKDTPQGDVEGNAGMKKLARTKGQLNINKPREVRMRANEEFDIFDAILEYLVTEGYADTNESALVIMANMSEEWRQSIVEVKMDPRGRPASGSMNVYAKSKPNTDPAFQAALKSVRDADAKKTPEQRKAELDAYRERQMNNK